MNLYLGTDYMEGFLLLWRMKSRTTSQIMRSLTWTTWDDLLLTESSAVEAMVLCRGQWSPRTYSPTSRPCRITAASPRTSCPLQVTWVSYCPPVTRTCLWRVPRVWYLKTWSAGAWCRRSLPVRGLVQSVRWRVSGLQLAAGVNLVAQVIGQQVGTKHKIYIPVLIFQTIIFTFFSYLLEEELCKKYK